MTLRVSPDEIVARSTSPLLGIASHWKRVPVGLVAEITNGAAFKSAHFNKTQTGMPLIRIRDVGASETSVFYEGEYEARYVVQSGDLLVGMDGDFRVARWRGPTALLNQRVCRIKVRDRALFDERFLELVLPPYLDAVHELTSAVTVKHLSSRTVEDLPVPLPPLSEQRRIVAAIEDCLSSLDAAESSVLSSSKALDPLLAEATKRTVLGAGAREAPPRPGQQAVHDEWVWMRLDELGELGRGKSKHRPRNDPTLYGGPYPFVQTGDVKRAEGRLRSYSQTYNELGLEQSRLWPAGTVLITIAANIAESAVLDFAACFPDSVVGLVPDAAIVRSEWVEYFIRTAKADLARYAPATAQKNINLRVLREVLVPVPPLTVQDSLLEALSSIESTAAHLKRATDCALSHSAALRRSILAAAFSGRLVAQDPCEEPAAVLLERIASERAAAKPSRHKKAKP